MVQWSNSSLECTTNYNHVVGTILVVISSISLENKNTLKLLEDADSFEDNEYHLAVAKTSHELSIHITRN